MKRNTTITPILYSRKDKDNLYPVKIRITEERKSQFISLGFSIVVYIVWVFFLLRKTVEGRRYLTYSLLGFFFIAPILIYSIYLIQPELLKAISWPIELLKQIKGLDFANFNAVSSVLGNRPEFFMAGVRMISEFPFLGVGQGDFYRMSPNLLFTGSQLLHSINGENAHNYFLQTIAETGFIGGLVFMIALAGPFFMTTNRRALWTASIGLFALLLGNIYAHSFLVRENLLLGALFLALMYSWTSANQVALRLTINIPNKTKWWADKNNWLIGVSCCVIVFGAAREIKESFSSFPFNYGELCFISKDLISGDWSTGLSEIDLPSQARGVKVALTAGHPDIDRRPIMLQMELIDSTNKVLAKSLTKLQTNDPTIVILALDQPLIVASEPLKAIFKLSGCFTPRNIGMNADGRRLGIFIKEKPDFF